jgi:hypothetical protein
MTYQNLGYWIGQANDTSTGTHPPGWANGQRWSETAGEWQVDRNSWYGNAVDTSTGAHPPGWSNGQLWSETATEWMNDRNAVYTSRYNEGYAAGAASKTTTAVGTSTSGTGGLPSFPSTSGDLGGVNCPRTGLAHISFRTGSNGDDAAVHIFRNGVLAIQGSSANGGLNTTFAVQGNLNVNQGDWISARASGDGNSGLQGGYLLVTVGSV